LRDEHQIFTHDADRNRVIVMVEPRSDHPLLEAVIRNAVWATSGEWNVHIFTHYVEHVESLFPDCSLRLTAMEDDSITTQEYSDLLLTEDSWEMIPEENILIIQTDVIFLRQAMVLESFMGFAFSGANYYNPIHCPPSCAGVQGGFSLRKKSMMLQCLSEIQDYKNLPEDVFFTLACLRLRLPLPPVGMRRLFSIECEYYDKPLGIHAFDRGLLPDWLITRLYENSELPK
jgi:hypothetical protein